MISIKVDYDSPSYPDITTAAYRLRFLGVRIKALRLSRSRHNGWHALFIIHGKANKSRLSNSDIITLQLLCGSNPKREMFNLARVLQLRNAPRYWRDKWNVLYEA